MNIDRQMVSLFFEIKRHLPDTSQDDMKIASPDVGERLIDIYQQSKNPSLKTLIESFFERAGDDWSKRIIPNKRFGLTFLRGHAQ